ncbi:5326_t:CDS:2 [Ambispora leptoticha]|uniref:40S ribosomal protein S30 n=1 Tax=Ambispora leptoticha TaxID=144679 RepID=A0A9N9CMB7_9GLOM|nr:5326_t:CDS:2 [Ambispora leptoticha]
MSFHGSLARAGKVKSQTPKVKKKREEESEIRIRKPKVGRAKKRILYNRRFVNKTSIGGKRRMNPAPTSDKP